MPRPWPPHEIRLARAWRDIGMTNRQVGEALDRTLGAVREMVGRRRTYVRAITKQTIADVSKETGITAEQIVGRCRAREIVYARWMVWKRLYEAGMSLSDIGREMAYDHKSIIHGLTKLGYTKRPTPPPPPSAPRERVVRPAGKRQPPGLKAEQRRAEMIREYWAQRGIDVDARVVATPAGDKINGSVAAVRSTNIPVRGSV